jgi:hypothetical protein
MILRFRGGLGNQMFQYALYRSIQGQGINIKADTTAYEYDDKRKFILDTFPNIKLEMMGKDEFDNLFSKYQNRNKVVKVINKIIPQTDIYFKEKQEGIFDKKIFGLNNKILDGYFQNEKYFSDIRTELLSELVFPNMQNKKFADICNKVKNDAQSVSIHIRRGDYLELENLYGGICTIEYYKKAMQYMTDSIGEMCYYVLSDDIEWTKANIPIKNATYIESKNYECYEDWYDMYLMSICHHNIIANSSFSWWGAWLNRHNDKTVIRPVKWNNNSNMEGMCPNGWVKI